MSKADVYDRLVEVLGTYDVTPEERRTVLNATAEAQSWNDVPADVRKLVEEIEGRPRQSWDDPADLPDQQ